MAWRDIRTSVLRQFPLICRRQAVDGEIITPPRQRDFNGGGLVIRREFAAWACLALWFVQWPSTRAGKVALPASRS
jgi:hypothetical protein